MVHCDALIVGGGPAGMACALNLSQLIDEHNKKNPDWPLSKENIYVLEKAREVGQHCLSGALLDPRSMRELLPGFEADNRIQILHRQVPPRAWIGNRIRVAPHCDLMENVGVVVGGWIGRKRILRAY